MVPESWTPNLSETSRAETRTIKFVDVARTIDRPPPSRHLWGVLTGAIIATVPVFLWLYAHCFYAC